MEPAADGRDSAQFLVEIANTMDITEHVPLSSLTTFRVGGPARYLITIHDVQKLPEAVAFAKSKKLPIFTIGSGSNLLASDEALEAVFIKIAPKGIKNGVEYIFDTDTGTNADNSVDAIADTSVNISDSLSGNFADCHGCTVVANAGEKWDEFVADTVSRGFSGIENLSLIPGTVGAAPVQNIGAYGCELSDAVEWVEIFDAEAGTEAGTKDETKERNHAAGRGGWRGQHGRGGFCRLNKQQCEFGYRSSIFKKPEGKNFIVTKVAFRLHKNAKTNISYKDLKKYFEEAGIIEPTIQEVRNAVIVIRKRKLPDPDFIANAGSFFKNPVISKEHAEELLSRFPNLPVYPLYSTPSSTPYSSHSTPTNLVKVSAAWIIDHVCGLGHAASGADVKVSVYEHQPLVIVNRGNATAKEIKNFSEMVALVVKEKTKINLETEVEFVSNKNF